MLPLYLFALIIGGGLLLFSLVHGAGGHAHVADGAELDHDVGSGLEGDGWLEIQDFLSVRTLLYLLAGFGASGTLIDLLTGASAGVTLSWALLTGIAAAAMASTIYAWVRRSDSGIVPTEADYLVGATGRVVLPIRPGYRGKIVAVQDGREVELLARLFGRDDLLLERGSQVVIVDIDGDTALVSALPLLSSDSSLE